VFWVMMSPLFLAVVLAALAPVLATLVPVLIGMVRELISEGGKGGAIKLGPRRGSGAQGRAATRPARP
jgi:hypothetical protein